MFWILTVLVCVAKARKCEVSSEVNKLLKPRTSVDSGAKFLSHSKAVTAECHGGCCDAARCDTSFHTGSKLDGNGDNCFYFECDGKCAFENSTGKSSGNFSIAQVIPDTDTPELPDFSDVFDSDNDIKSDFTDNGNKTAVHTNHTGLQDSDNAFPSGIDQITVKDETITSNSTITDSLAGELVTENKDKNVDSHDVTVQNITVITSDNDEIKQANTTSNQNNNMANNSSQTVHTDKTAGGDKSIEVDEIPESDIKTADTDKQVSDARSKPPPTETKVELEDYDKKPVTPTPSKSNDTVIDDTHAQVNETLVVDKQNDEESVSIKNHKDTTNVKVEINIQEENRRYTVKDVVLWVSVVGGSALILFGLAIIIRVYRNKRRRLYSSLTDDYLINGMYSI